MFDFGIQPLELVARTAIVYLVFIVVLRVFGKRELGQFTIFDLVLLLLAANALQPAMTGPDMSVGGGVVILATVFALNWLVAQARERLPWLRRLLEPEPTVLARDGALARRSRARRGPRRARPCGGAAAARPGAGRGCAAGGAGAGWVGQRRAQGDGR